MNENLPDDLGVIEYAKELLKENRKRDAIDFLRRVNTPTARMMLAKLDARPALSRWHFCVFFISCLLCGIFGLIVGILTTRSNMYAHFLKNYCVNYQVEQGASIVNTEACNKWVDTGYWALPEFLQNCIDSGRVRMSCFDTWLGSPPWPADVPLPIGSPTLTPEGYIAPTLTPFPLYTLESNQ